MSLLDSTKTISLSPEQIRKREIVQKSRALLQFPRALYEDEFKKFKTNIELLWLDPSPDEILKEIGTKATELFQLSELKVKFLLAAIDQGCTPEEAKARKLELQAVMAVVKECDFHPDGTVTIK